MTSILAHAPAVDSSFDDIVMGLGLEPFRAGIDDVKRVARGFNRSLSPVVGQHRDEVWAGGRFDGIAEGRTFSVSISPGTVALSVVDTLAAERAVSAAYDRHLDKVDSVIDELLEVNKSESRWYDVYTDSPRYDFVGWEDGVCITVLDRETGELIGAPASTRSEIKEWSKKSRMRMVRAVAEMDYSNWGSESDVLAMVTLTLPGDWLAVAPTGKAFKKKFKAFEARFRRATGDFKTLWKLEFQDRGAPHIHMLMKIPVFVGDVRFEDWLSLVWADICGSSKVVDRKDGSSEYSRHLAAGTGVDYSGSTFSDPRRIAIYFLGHSFKSEDNKEYQHKVPKEWQLPGAGPGRFWGAPGFVRAAVSLEITMQDFHRLARQLRKLRRSRDWVTEYKRDIAADPSASAVNTRYKKLKSEGLGATGKLRGGWVLLNDALAVTMQLTEWLHSVKK